MFHLAKPLQFLALLFLCALLGACRCNEGRPPDGGGPDAGEKTSAAAGKRKAAPPGANKALGALPYLNWQPVEGDEAPRQGVTRFIAGEPAPGLNLFNSRPRHLALLMDLRGKVVHRWSSAEGQPGPVEHVLSQVWPQLDFAGWHHVEAGQDGALYAIVPYHLLLKLSWDSRVLWKTRLTAHHDVALGPGGTLYTLDTGEQRLPLRGTRLPLLDNRVVELDARGKVRRRISLLSALRRSPATRALIQKKLSWALGHHREAYVRYYLLALASLPPAQAEVVRQIYASILDGSFQGSDRTKALFMTLLAPMDLIHANAVARLPRGRPPYWEEGDLLLTLRELNLVIVLDPRRGRVRWAWGAETLDRPHHPSLLPDDTLLVFDNGSGRGHSRVVAVDPKEGEIVWSYRGTPPQSFFSPIRGGCQRLPGGNTLITESEKGRVFEVTPAGETVWEYYNPDLVQIEGKPARAPIYRMVRLPRERFPQLAR